MRGVLNRLRRVAAVRLVVMFAVMAAALIGGQIARHQFGGSRAPPAQDIAVTLILCAATLAIYAGLVRLFERRTADELRPGFRWAGLGALIGFGLFCAVYGVLGLLGVASWAGFQGVAGVSPALMAAALAGICEELAVRGVLFRVLEDSLGTAAAIAASAVVFGLLHALNHGATVVSTAAIALEAGVMLAAAYAWSRNLWLPIGLHIAWNFTEGGVFGAAVSGGKGHGSLAAVNFTPGATDLLTGGAFGPEASLVTVVLCLAAGAAFMLAAVRAGHWRRPSFRMLLD
jgi:hypothetical protein